ncbi:LysR family transcriptional regulator [Allopusillimonas ginsengisoli]|uniref:LysR family transcriptional regulator n=1 Tax=Allopusillimonas ginsengisoli TaxID=453575 RepID=UPI0010210D42|nr:LysR family transcriptional regulator [Allopusillimonas ginsengisoli]TEA77752.1 LysR family transcriptional regulator [Allopusillimonas ginsengisoli]
MELRHLRYFIVVAEHGSVRVASSHLHISQPAISRQIHDLEEELGVQLFDRTTRGLRLTKAGGHYLIEARRALAMIDAAGKSTQMVARGRLGRLSIGLVEIAAWEGFVPLALGEFQKNYGQVYLQLHPVTTPEQLLMIENGTLDGGFVYAFDPLPEDFESVMLARHDVVLATPLNWRERVSSHPSIRSLVNEPFVTFQRPVYPTYYDRLLNACSQTGLTMRIVQEVGSEAAVLSLVSAGIGIAIVNSCNRWRAPSRVRFLELEDLSVPLPLSFVYLRSNSNPALVRFVETLKEALQPRG